MVQFLHSIWWRWSKRTCYWELKHCLLQAFNLSAEVIDKPPVWPCLGSRLSDWAKGWFIDPWQLVSSLCYLHPSIHTHTRTHTHSQTHTHSHTHTHTHTHCHTHTQTHTLSPQASWPRRVSHPLEPEQTWVPRLDWGDIQCVNSPPPSPTGLAVPVPSARVHTLQAREDPPEDKLSLEHPKDGRPSGP